MSEHTPEPWAAHGHKIMAVNKKKRGPIHIIVAEASVAWRGSNEAAANARLIAAAPDLLAALGPVAKEIKDKCADLQHPSWDTDHHREITLTIGECRAILAALKKAGGEP